ncbi:MAG: hypothetical protein IJX77_10530 [Ruminococcus sp.]|nr:hypothetical protein [Ruminococcus sp.]
MAIRDLIGSFRSDKKALTAVTVLGAAGLVLIMLSSLLPGDSGDEEKKPAAENSASAQSEDFCADTERRLTDFLRNIEGVGEVQVYLTISGDEEYVYATEGKTSISENKTEEEHSYVMIGGSGSKTALVETVRSPEITGAVIACSGCDSAAVQEKVYKAVSTALGIPTSQIYVTKLK